ncbi:MAG: hypothetical protein JW928_05085, partial [Candidatus Aureabacteria bacterium]|nr:hypothetical protein [Candidatus Auribacterota bacterium]
VFHQKFRGLNSGNSSNSTMNFCDILQSGVFERNPGLFRINPDISLKTMKYPLSRNTWNSMYSGKDVTFCHKKNVSKRT